MRRDARDEISRLIQFLDASDEYVMNELEDDDEREDGGEAEPSIGCFDRMNNQEKSWKLEAATRRVHRRSRCRSGWRGHESSLGASERYHPSNQSYWESGDSDDR